MLSAVAGLGERSGDPLSPLYQALITQRRKQPQPILTQDQWQAAWQVGHAWTPAQAADAAERRLGLAHEG